ncbi:ABC transporter ATP-binding protein [Pseudonocardia sulfidoxydans NBRC 16205]|jgi:branched-chain amino acid transport system ATP-binding protein|uniref:ABC transporter ATP-binding protein n=1 Tax=Pseudonocardia sulfidoxydans NBRC 16205 TaxID=1223511 RepID=A0A511DPL7_9PSEU|nr:ABC transporter ATP-binding protein [Pseudonocardia sulfidoxydans]GEL26769.1 ABC transporter ATP-binding protein [Pseudonocardia sulfidoxydans NBRC 16205]
MSEVAPLLELTRVEAGYGKNRVLHDVSLTVAPGEVVGLIGRNGAGKTTTARVVSGLLTPGSGDVRFRGDDLRGSPVRAARAGIAHVPQGRGLFAGLSVMDNLRAGAYAVGRDLDRATVDDILRIFPPLEKLLGRRAGLLSGGEQQMVTIARGIASHPVLMIVDELSLGLAPIIVDFTWAALLSLRDEHQTAILIIDQNTDRVIAKCDRTFHLRDGATSLVTGTPDDKPISDLDTTRVI